MQKDMLRWYKEPLCMNQMSEWETGDMEDLENFESSTNQQIPLAATQPKADDGQDDETWEIRITPKLKH